MIIVQPSESSPRVAVIQIMLNRAGYELKVDGRFGPKTRVAVAPTLSRLRKYFAPYGAMEHGGCSLGGVANTRKLMHRLADLWAVPVSVGVGIQISILHFDGSIFTAYPDNGTLTTWTEPFREASY
jgi:hypothetical protein